MHLFHHLSSPKLFLRCEISCQVWGCTTKIISISYCESLKFRLFYCKLSSRKQGNLSSVFHRYSLKYSNDHRDKLDCNWLFLLQIEQREKYRITCHCSVKLQTTKQTLTTWKHSIEFTYNDFPCHLIVSRDKLALVNRWWKCKKGKGWQLQLVNSRKLTNMTISPMLFPIIMVTVVRDRKIWTVLTTNFLPHPFRKK